MLILTRKRDEVVLLGRPAVIAISVVEIRGDKVRLGFEAPDSLPIHRSEIYDRIDRQDLRPLQSSIDQARALLARAFTNLAVIETEIPITLADRLHAISGDVAIARMLLPDKAEEEKGIA